MARRATRIAQERAQGNTLLVLDAGNSLVGDQEPASSTQGQTSVAAMNLMGYDAMVLGTMDLALGLTVVQQRINEAEFAVLSADAVVAATSELVASPYVLRVFDDRQVAIIGLSGGSDFPEIVLRDPVEAVQTALAEVSNLADIVILLSHADSSTNQRVADAVPGIDLIVSGGDMPSTDAWYDEKMETFIVHADQATPGHAGRMMGAAQLTFDAKGRLVGRIWQRLQLGPEIPDDPVMADWVQRQ